MGFVNIWREKVVNIFRTETGQNGLNLRIFYFTSNFLKIRDKFVPTQAQNIQLRYFWIGYACEVSENFL